MELGFQVFRPSLRFWEPAVSGFAAWGCAVSSKQVGLSSQVSDIEARKPQQMGRVSDRDPNIIYKEYSSERLYWAFWVKATKFSARPGRSSTLAEQTSNFHVTSCQKLPEPRKTPNSKAKRLNPKTISP